MPYKDLEVAKIKRKEYYLKNKEKLKNKERTLEQKQRISAASYKWMSEHPEYRLLKQARDSSKQRGLECTINIEDIVIPKVCTYLGVLLSTTIDGGRQDNNISLDRIDNSLGYVPGNVQVISSKANFMKRNASIEELIRFAKGILDTHISSSL